MAFHDLRGFLQALEASGRLRHVAQVVDPELESTSLCLRAQRARGPALLFEQPRGSSHPLLGNLFGHRERIEAALAGRPLASLRELGELLASLKEPRWPASLREATDCVAGVRTTRARRAPSRDRGRVHGGRDRR